MLARVTKVDIGTLTGETSAELAVCSVAKGVKASDSLAIFASRKSGTLGGSWVNSDEVEVSMGGTLARVSTGRTANSRFTRGCFFADVVSFLSGILMISSDMRPMTVNMPIKRSDSAIITAKENLDVFFSCCQRLICTLGSNFSVDPVYSTEGAVR